MNRTVFFTDRDLGNTFPDMLQAAGISVERHSAHFADDISDQDWLARIRGRGWIVLTRDKSIRRRPNELAAVEDASIAMFAIVGKAPHAVLAANFIATLPRIEAFIKRHTPPYIARVYQPDARERKKLRPKGRVELAWEP